MCHNLTLPPPLPPPPLMALPGRTMYTDVLSMGLPASTGPSRRVIDNKHSTRYWTSPRDKPSG